MTEDPKDHINCQQHYDTILYQTEKEATQNLGVV